MALRQISPWPPAYYQPSSLQPVESSSYRNLDKSAKSPFAPQENTPAKTITPTSHVLRKYAPHILSTTQVFVSIPVAQRVRIQDKSGKNQDPCFEETKRISHQIHPPFGM